MKYIITQAFGKQHIFKPNEFYDINLSPSIPHNSYLVLTKILFFKNATKVQIGTPIFQKTQVVVKVIQSIKLPKITILKTKPKKKYTRVKGLHPIKTRIYVLN